jgi:hypothetical protein
MNKEEYTEIDNYNLSEMLFNRDERLIEMIKGLREERDYIFNKLTCEKGYLQEKLNKKEYRIDKAIEYIEEHKEPLHHSFDEPDCDYWIATNPDDLLNILRGGKNE